VTTFLPVHDPNREGLTRVTSANFANFERAGPTFETSQSVGTFVNIRP